MPLLLFPHKRGAIGINVAASVIPIWLAKVIGILTCNDGLKFASRLMAYFDEVGELGDPVQANRILRAGDHAGCLDRAAKKRDHVR